jgi:aminoglycoside phosphotransferase (APT) family kinase protein
VPESATAARQNAAADLTAIDQFCRAGATLPSTAKREGEHEVSQYPPETRQIETVMRHIFPSLACMVERVTEGGSTFVYRMLCGDETFYLRVLPEEDASFAPEVAAHTILRQRQVNVPEVIYFEQRNKLVQRSIMLTTAIKGRPLSQSPGLSVEVIEAIVSEAGRDLALINSVPVEGFGWVKRDSPSTSTLQAPWPTYRAFALERWDADLAFLARSTLSSTETAMLERLISQYDSYLNSEESCLAHGDFDSTHIYQEAGRFTGIIDLGEIRGTDRWYDLGHFHLHEGKQLSLGLEAALVRSFGAIVPLPSDYVQRIRWSSLLINVRALARSLQKRPANRYTQHLLEVLREDLAFLL